MNRHNILLQGGAAITLAATSTAAWSYEPPSTPSIEEPKQSALPPSPAIQTGEQDIIVTATKRAGGQGVQKAPLAITALGPQQLAESQVATLADLTKSVPNVTMNGATTVPGTPIFFIRGMGTSGTIPSSTPGVGIFVDGVYLGVSAGSVLDTFDLEGVEVLRGPQGLLFGRNVTGGAVLLRTTAPSDTLTISAKASVDGALNGTGLNYTEQGIVSGPLTKAGNVRAKFAVYRNDDDGYFRNLFDGNDNFGKRRTTVLRGALAYDLNADVTTTLRYEHGWVSGDGAAFQSRDLNFGKHNFDVDINFPGDITYEWNQAIDETNIRLGRGTITNVLGYRNINQLAAGDVDGLPQALLGQETSVRQHQISDELRYSGTFGPVTATAGVFFYQDYLKYVEARVLPTGNVVGGGNVKSTQYAAFSAFDVAVTDQVTINLGARYSWQRKFGEVQRSSTTSPCSVEQGDCTSYAFHDHHTWTSFTPKIGVQWSPTRSTNAYASWTRGFRDGGYNVRQTSAAAPGPYDQERVDAYEIGLKQRLFDDHVTLNLSAFRNEYKGLQRDISQTDPIFGLVQFTVNAANVRIQGVEGELTVKAGDFRFGFNAGYLDPKYEKIFFDLSGNGSVGPEDYRLRLPYAPPWTYGTSITYHHRLGSGNIRATITYTHRDRTLVQDNNSGYLETRNNIDTNIEYDLGSSGLSFGIYGLNLTNNKVNGLDSPLTVSGVTTQLRPIEKGRRFGLSVAYKM